MLIKDKQFFKIAKAQMRRDPIDHPKKFGFYHNKSGQEKGPSKSPRDLSLRAAIMGNLLPFPCYSLLFCLLSFPSICLLLGSPVWPQTPGPSASASQV
jgi:hypothetical protein